jgi:hypothetical protein
VYIGSNEHKELFCRSFMESHRAYDPKDWPWPELDDVSLARLRAIPIWTMALEVEIGAGDMLAGFAKTENDPLVREALELQGYEEERHGRILKCMIDRYGIRVTPEVPKMEPTRHGFVDFGYNECVDSFAGFGIFRLARDARILPDALTSLFSRLLVEEARHIVFFVELGRLGSSPAWIARANRTSVPDPGQLRLRDRSAGQGRHRYAEQRR